MRTLPEFLRRFGAVVEARRLGRSRSLELDMRRARFFRPAGLATLTAAILALKRLSVFDACSVVRPEDPAADQYLARTSFYELFEVPHDLWYMRGRTPGSMCELIEVRKAPQIREVATEVATILRSRTEIGDRAAYSLEYALVEIIENVFEHADSPINAIVCAQSYRYSNHNQMELAIVDGGRGFRASLRDNPQLAGQFGNATEAIQLALRSKITGRRSGKGGEGLFFTAELVKHNGGDMLICSENGLVRIDAGTLRVGAIDAQWRGAIVAICFRVDGPIDVKALYDRFAPGEDNDYLLPPGLGSG